MSKILFCTGSYSTGKGGVASYAHDFIDVFADKYTIDVVTSDDYVKSEQDCCNSVVRCDSSDFSIDNAKLFLNIVENKAPDIIINSGFALLSLVAPFIPNNIKIVTVSHFVSGPQAWYAGFNSEYLDEIIALSSFGAQYIIDKFGISGRTKVHRVFNFMPAVTPNYEDKRNNATLKIVYPGGSTYFKSSEVVCRALKNLLKTDLQFEFYWIGNNALANAGLSFLPTKTINDCLGNDSRIKHIGSVPREKAKQIIKEANIFLLPSRGEGFPITLIEAMRCGCIPIVSDAKHGSLDAIENGVNGFVVRQNSSKDIVDIVTKIITNHESYHYIYENSYNYYRANLTESVWKGQMLDVLDSGANHCARYTFFDKIEYDSIKNDFKRLFVGHRLKDRMRYIRLFFYYRFVRYCV